MMATLPITRDMWGSAGSLVAGIVSAAIFSMAFVHPGVTFILLSCVSAFCLFLAGLAAGVASGAFASMVAAFALWVFKSALFGAFYLVLLGLPAIGMTYLALRRAPGNDDKWFPEGMLLTLTALYPCVLFAAGVAAAMGHPGGLLGLTNEYLAAGVEQFRNLTDAQQFTYFVNLLAHTLPLIIGCTWILFMLVTMYLSEAGLKPTRWNLRPDFDIQNLALPQWLFPIAVVCGLVAGFAPPAYAYVGLNLSFMLGFPFIFAGISVVHAWAARSVFRVWILVGYYILLSLPFAFTLIPMFGITLLLGVLDQWVNFRRHFAVKSALGRIR